LEWDSEFFGFPIGQGSAVDEDDVVAADRWADAEGIRCLYLPVPADCLAAVRVAEERGFRLVGARATSVLDLSIEADAADAPRDGVLIRTVHITDVARLEEIAAGAHTSTRFYVDPLFSRAACDRLYRTWIRRSCEGWADHVLVADSGTDAVGYLTLHAGAEKEGRIGLVGVAAEMRGHGIGLALMRAALAWCRANGMRRLTVATQAHNLRALQLYARCGFQPAGLDFWFHKWR